MTADGPVLSESPLHGVEAVIFDFDGVVVDSEPLSLGTLHASLLDFGVEIGLDEVRHRFLGKSLREIGPFVDAHGNRPAADGFDKHWQDQLFGQFRRELQPMDGIVPLLDRLEAASIPFCIASGASLERLALSLEIVGLATRFGDRVYSVEFVERDKPAPDIFLYAASKLATPRETSLVIEDSPAGIQGAVTAGMRALGFVGGGHLAGIRQTHASLLTSKGAGRIIATLEDAGNLFTQSRRQ